MRAKARKAAATSAGLMVDVRARFGFTAAPDGSDDARLRHLTLALPPHHGRAPLRRPGRRRPESQTRQVAAEALGEVYFRDGGRRAAGLEVELIDVEDIPFEL